MKSSKTCPKCSSTKIGSFPGNYEEKITISWIDSGSVTHYVCANCGFMETWIANPKDLDKVARKTSD